MIEKEKEIATLYSGEIPGDRGNYNWAVLFDSTNGYIGISQRADDRPERVLLSPRQFKALIEWVKEAARGDEAREGEE